MNVKAAFASAEEYEALDPNPWPAPDMSLIRSERRDPPPFPAEVFGPCADWIKAAAECKGAAPDYVGHTLLTVVGSLIGNTRWAAPQSGWSEPPILFSALIGDPSAGKSPAMDAVLDPVRELETDLAHDYTDKLQEHEDAATIAAVSKSAWKEDIKAAVKDGSELPARPSAARTPDAPVRPRLSFSGATPEKVAEILEALWRSVLLRRDELSGWLGNMNKYSGGGDRAFWLEAYGGRSYTVERVKRPEPITVDRLTVGIIGTIQPDRLSTLLLNGDDDGLLARLAIVWPERAPLRRPTMSVDETVARRAFQRLHELQPAYDEDGKPRPHFVPFDDGAVELLYKFRECCRGFEDTSEGLMKSHIGKFPGLAVRLSVIFAYLDWAIGDVAAEPGRVTAAHLGRACHYVAEYLRPMAIRAYGDAAAPSEERAAIQLARMILDAHWTEFSIRDVVAKKRSGLRSSKEVNAATRVLIEAGWIRMETGPKPQRGPSRTVHAVNPAIYGENMP
jgi:hypothetical protein